MKNWGLGLAGVLFYAAPIGAGLTGAAYFAVLPFTVLFFLWLLVMRHQPFRDGPGLALPTLMIHFALASMCLGLGQMLRALLGVTTTAPLLAWLAMGLGALALGRIFWKPKEEAQVEAFLEKALKSLNDFADDAEEIVEADPDLPLAHPTQAEASVLATAYGQIDTLPADGASTADLTRRLEPVIFEVRSQIAHTAFMHRAERTGARRDRHAVLLLASDGGLAWNGLGDRRMAEVFDLIVDAADTITLARYLTLSEALLRDFPTTVNDMPDVTRLLDISDQIQASHPELSDGLIGLSQKIEDTQAELSGHD